MPAIRDFTTNVTTATSTSLQSFMPSYQAGDLLVALVNNTSTTPFAAAQVFWANVGNVTANITGTTSNVYTINSGVIGPGSVMNNLAGLTGITAGTKVLAQVASFAASSANTTVVSGGSSGTNYYTANTVTGVYVGNLVVGTNVPSSTYVSSISGNTITLTQNFSGAASGYYNFYPSGGTGTYTVSPSQTVANSFANISYSTLYSQLNGNVAHALLYRVASGTESDTLISYTTTGFSQVHLISVQDANPYVPFSGTAVTNTDGNVLTLASTTAVGWATANVGCLFFSNIGTNGMLYANAVLSGNLVTGANIGLVAGAAIAANTVIVNQINGTPSTVGATATYVSGSGNTVVLSGVSGTISAGNLVGNVTGINAGTYVTSYFSGNTTVVFSQNLNGTPSGTISFWQPGFAGNYTVSPAPGVAVGANLSRAGRAKGAMPQLVTANANSMLMFVNVDSTAISTGTVPMVLEGPVTYEDGADATQSSQGWGWTIQRTAGTSPNNVYWNKVGLPFSANGLVTTVSINPPPGGATVIPPYVVSDASIWQDPLNGVISYNLNNPVTANAVAKFSAGGTNTISGKTLINGTVATATDVGVNSYHGMAALTGVSTNGSWAGASYVPSSNVNVTGKNVLLHLKPSTPKVLQNTDSIGRSGVKGVAFGMASTANSAMKVWHVHGSNTLWNPATYVPVIINSGATTGVISSSGSLDTANIQHFGFFVSGSVTAPIWQFGSMWVLDTTVIAGGTSATPLGVAGLLKTCAQGKERLSVLEQGVSQALILQPIQFGDGGTNPVYLNMDSTVIEFPKQYDITSKQVYYNSTDNVAGITYFAGVGDTIIHTNAVLSSQNKFFWRFAPGSANSSVATYNFASTAIQGAGNIVLQPNIALSGITFTRCVEVQQTGGNLTSCIFANTIATSGNGAVRISGATESALQANLTALASSQINYNTLASGGLRIQYTGASTNNTAINLTSSTITFVGNNYDIYWDAPIWTPLNFKQTVLSGVATLSSATNNNTVSLPPIRSLVISGIVAGSNVTVYAQQNPTVSIAGTANVNAATSGTTINNLAIASDSVNTGKYTATYSYVYTTAFGSTSGSSTTLTVSTLISGNITVGMTVNGTGVTAGTTITALGSGTGGAGTYTLSQAATVAAGAYLQFDAPVNITVLALGYQALRPTSTLTYSGAAVTVNQAVDRQYSNPA